MKKNDIIIYTLCAMAGGLISYYSINLPPSGSEKPEVKVDVHVPEPTIIHDTIVITDTKYKYIIKKRCCCGECNNMQRDSVR